MSEKKPTPLMTYDQKPKLCPVCGKRSYSKAGIHPQCAVVQADAPRVNRLNAARKTEQAARQQEKERNS